MHSTIGQTAVPALREVPSRRSLFIESAARQLETWEQRLNTAIDEAKPLVGEARALAEARIEQLRYRIEDAHEQIAAMKAAATEPWDEAKTHFEMTWNEVLEIFAARPGHP